MFEKQLSLAGFAEIASKRANRICCGQECESFIAHSSTISHSLWLWQSVVFFSFCNRRKTPQNPEFDIRFLRLAAVVEACGCGKRSLLSTSA